MCRPHPRQLPEEDPSPARRRGQASGKCGGGSAPPARPKHAGTGNSTRGTQQLREHWRSPLNWAGWLFGKSLHLWGNTSWLRSPLPNFPTFFKSFKTKTEKRGRKKKQIKGKHTSFGKRCSSHTGRLQGLRRHCTRSVKFSGKTPRHFSSSLCWFQSLSFTPMSQPSSCGQQSVGNTGPRHNTLQYTKKTQAGLGGPCLPACYSESYVPDCTGRSLNYVLSTST